MPEVFDDTIAPGFTCGSTPGDEVALDVERLDDGFDDPVGVGDGAEVVETAGLNQVARAGQEAGVGLERSEPIEACPRRLRRQVQEADGHAGIGQVGRNLGAHGAGTEDSSRPANGPFHRPYQTTPERPATDGKTRRITQQSHAGHESNSSL